MSEGQQLETQEEHMFQCESEGRKKADVLDLRQSGRKNYFFLGGESAPLFYSGLQLIGYSPPTFGKAICFTKSADLNVNLV